MRFKFVFPVLALLFLTCCTAPDNAAFTYDESKPHATVSVIGFKGEVIFKEFNVGITEKSTIFDVTNFAAKQKKIPLNFSGGGSTVYIKGINGLNVFDKGAKSGWIYIVNGKRDGGSKGCGSYILKDGDSVTWYYTTDLGKDIDIDL